MQSGGLETTEWVSVESALDRGRDHRREHWLRWDEGRQGRWRDLRTDRAKTPNEIALSILLSGLSIVFLVVVVSLKYFFQYYHITLGQDVSIISVPVLIALLVCLIPTTIGGLLSDVGISGMDRLLRHNVIAMSGRAVEAAGDIDVLLLDKTGTITLGNRMAIEFVPAHEVTEEYLANAAQLASLADETPEGRSIVVLAKERFAIRER